MPHGNVLVVGASATGAQLAEEIQASGRQVTLAVGTHVRLPRRYRGEDILTWMVGMGGFSAAADPTTERLSPPPQLIGAPDNRDLDLVQLQRKGVRLVGRATAALPDRMLFADDLAETLGKADAQLEGLLAKIDAYIEANACKAEPAPANSQPVPCPPPTREFGFAEADIRSIIWATGYQRSYPWLKLAILDARGDIRHHRGVTTEPGVVVLGMRFQSTKGSNLIDGVGADAEELAAYLTDRSNSRRAA